MRKKKMFSIVSEFLNIVKSMCRFSSIAVEDIDPMSLMHLIQVQVCEPWKHPNIPSNDEKLMTKTNFNPSAIVVCTQIFNAVLEFLLKPIKNQIYTTKTCVNKNVNPFSKMLQQYAN